MRMGLAKLKSTDVNYIGLRFNFVPWRVSLAQNCTRSMLLLSNITQKRVTSKMVRVTSKWFMTTKVRHFQVLRSSCDQLQESKLMFNPFLTNILILYPPGNTKNLRLSVFRGCKLKTFARNK